MDKPKINEITYETPYATKLPETVTLSFSDKQHESISAILDHFKTYSYSPSIANRTWDAIVEIGSANITINYTLLQRNADVYKLLTVIRERLTGFSDLAGKLLDFCIITLRQQ